MKQIDILREWYQTAEGKRFSSQVDIALRSTIESTFGYSAAQFTLDRPSLLEHSPINYRIKACQNNSQVSCNASSMPFDSESLDLVILSHTLECVSDPHAVLREVERVLVGEGSLIIIGMSPLSMSHMAARMKEIKRSTHRYTSRRVCEWLDVLGFETAGGGKIAIDKFNVKHDKKFITYRNYTLNRLANSITGLGYYICAKKRITRITPIHPGWYKKPRLIYSSDTGAVSNNSTSHVAHIPRPDRDK